MKRKRAVLRNLRETALFECHGKKFLRSRSDGGIVALITQTLEQRGAKHGLAKLVQKNTQTDEILSGEGCIEVIRQNCDYDV